VPINNLTALTAHPALDSAVAAVSAVSKILVLLMSSEQKGGCHVVLPLNCYHSFYVLH
jgi:hypothetical protein